MRSQVFSLILISAALMGSTDLASAQSPTSYPWCAKYYKEGFPTSCYFTSRAQCMTTVSGVGGYCFESPYYHASAPAFGQAASAPRRRRHY